MKEWILELCPEIAEWQAELIAEQCEQRVKAEREACAKVCESAEVLDYDPVDTAENCAAAIRTRGGDA